VLALRRGARSKTVTEAEPIMTANDSDDRSHTGSHVGVLFADILRDPGGRGMLASLDGLPNDVEVSGVLICFELPCSFGIASDIAVESMSEVGGGPEVADVRRQRRD
jgi:hypothetical protein